MCLNHECQRKYRFPLDLFIVGFIKRCLIITCFNYVVNLLATLRGCFIVYFLEKAGVNGIIRVGDKYEKNHDSNYCKYNFNNT